MTTDEHKAAEGLISLKNYYVTGPINIPNNNKECEESNMNRTFVQYGLNTPSSYEDFIKENNHSLNLAATIERNMKIFAEYRADHTPPLSHEQQNEDTSILDFSARLAPICNLRGNSGQEVSITKNSEQQNTIVVDNDSNRIEMNSDIKFVHFQFPQQEIQNTEKFQDEQERYPHEQWEKIYRQQYHYKTYLQQQQQQQQLLRLQKQQREYDIENRLQENTRSDLTFARPLPVSHGRRNTSAFQYVTNRSIQNYSSPHLQTLQQHVVERYQPYTLANHSFHQAIALERATTRQQRQIEAGENRLYYRINQRKMKNIQPDSHKALETKDEEVAMDTKEEDPDVEMNDSHEVENCSSPDDRSMNGKRKMGKEKPRWSVEMREALFNAVIAHKGLMDMASFDWPVIGKQIGRSGKACKDQWRRALLPKLQQTFEASSQREQEEKSTEEMELVS
ncbi:uncharacterized protein BX663DRAFT_563181 [Cokeromyces recurvatus]|uniref:uncharacterized protein n=1 Tax=Cokeromyces recurvatus TaxID=90255 RepID=UPI00221FDA10|nr:uncharacterized protein BX663DRAFT_563181 [Cokeromyces recurvatus]KAI7900250.1 hypothetical protein BX663DRAFT_563181 [Cokeromyces recurvatus]